MCKSKSRPIPPGSPSGPKYVEFIVFAVLAVVGSAAIVVFLVKPANIPPIAEANSVATPEDTPEPITIAGGDEDGGQLTESVAAVPAQGQPGGTAPDQTYSLTITAADGTVTRSPDKASYEHGETVTLKAAPNKGHSFTNWLGDLSGIANPATLVMEADKSVIAGFAVKTYTLTATAADGSVTKSPDKASYKHGETVTLEAVPDKGYSFTNWSGDLSGGTNPATLVMDADKSVTAGLAAKTYTLTATAVDGSVTKSPDQAGYSPGETVTLEAVSNTGHNFTHWSGDLSGGTNPATLIMDADKSVTAGFAARTYTLTSTVMGGSVTRSSARAAYKHGETVTLEAVPNKGYSFKNWAGDLSGGANPAKLVMDADKSVTAGFAIET